VNGDEYQTLVLQDCDVPSRNSALLLEDAVRAARLLGKPGRYKLVRGLGRGISVCRRHGTAGGWLGYTMVAGGIAAVAWDSLTKEFSWARVGVLLVVCGAMIGVYAKLKARTEPNSETYKLGYDIGYEAGYQERDKMGKPPVLVDLGSRRSTIR
jgi:hypothetical protein